MRRFGRFALIAGCLYALAWIAYVAKAVAGIDLIPNLHFGGAFPGSDQMVPWLKARV